MSSCSACSGTGTASAMVAVKRAQIGQQAALKAAAMVLDVQKESGTRLIENLIRSANAAQSSITAGALDVLA